MRNEHFMRMLPNGRGSKGAVPSRDDNLIKFSLCVEGGWEEGVWYGWMPRGVAGRSG